MNSVWSDKKPWYRQTSKPWRQPRLTRSRRPLLLAFAAIALFLFWHQHASPNPEFYQHEPSPFKSHNHHSRPEHAQVAIPKLKPAPLKVSKQKPVRIGAEDQSPASKQREHTEKQQQEQQQQQQQLRRDRDKGDKGVQVVKSNPLEQADEEPIHDPDVEERRLRGENMVVELSDQPVLRAQEDRKNPEQDGVAPESDLEAQIDPRITKADQLLKEGVTETEPAEHLSLEEKGDDMPEIVHVPFEDAVRDMSLQGWEEDWVAHASFDAEKWGKLEEPRIDIVYLWVNGSEPEFQSTKRPFELNSVLNDIEGKWISSHGTNRYRDWDELRYSLRSVEQHAGSFRNKIQILVNSVEGTEARKQVPTWLNDDAITQDTVQVLAQEEFFDRDKHVCLPTFNSLTIENQIFNTPSDVDQLYALSDDMLLGKPHAASDIYSPLFGPVMGFKSNSYSTTSPPTEADAARFGEKPFLIYTSWLLNRRFGIRKRKGQGHFGHSLSRSVTREAIGSFPGPELQSACKRFRGEPGFQLYSWYATFHYVIERHREALLWSYIMLRSDVDGDQNLSWAERQIIMEELKAGMTNEGKPSYRKRNFYHVSQLLEKAGLEAPKVNTEILWTSLDGPTAIQNTDCIEFDVNECLAPGFSTATSDKTTKNPIFSTALVFDRVARQMPKCGDCLLKLILNQVPKGLSPLLPHAETQAAKREIVVKAVMRYRYTIINPDALFVMVTDADQIDSTLINRFIRNKKELAGQLCLNDDVATEDEEELRDVKQVMTELYQGLFPEKSPFEI